MNKVPRFLRNRRFDLLDLVKDLLTPNLGDDHDAKAEDDRVAGPPPPPKPRPRGGATIARDGWRPALSLLQLREQVNAAAPHRSIASDGMIGDRSHKKRTSDHNPWVDEGVVTAFDVTHDPARGCDAGALAQAIVDSRDPRVKYVIWNRKIANHRALDGQPGWTWRPYGGKNPHDKHVHVSVREDSDLYDDTSNWTLWKGAQRRRNGHEPESAAIAATFDGAAPVAWGRRVPAPFKRKAVEVANRLRMDPNHLMAVMAFETGREFKSDTRNALSGATGLIQFMPRTAEGLGTTTTQLARMTELDQLDFVEMHLRPFAGRMNDVPSAYMAVLLPSAVTKPVPHILFQSPKKAYRQNKGLDDADDDGKVTKAEAAAKVSQQLIEGMRPENFG